MKFNPFQKSFEDMIPNITISVLDFIDENPGTNGENIIQKMSTEYPEFSNRDYFNDDIYFILDVLSDKGFVYFDFTKDMWFLVEETDENIVIH